MSQPENSVMYRDFRYLRARFLLNQQDKLAFLEEELDAVDKADQANDSSLKYLKSRRLDVLGNPCNAGRPRQAILDDIYDGLKSYGK